MLFIARFEPDRFYVRHLLLFHDKDASESLLDEPKLANRYLAEAYELFAQLGIETDCPPLFELTGVSPSRPDTPSSLSLDAITGNEGGAGGERDLFCTYIHRSGILLAGGEMSTCGVQYAAKVGDLGTATSFFSLWNGDVMRKVPRDINTPNEWAQCRDCWFRQSRYHAQRSQRAQLATYPLRHMTTFSKKAWDFRGYEDLSR